MRYFHIFVTVLCLTLSVTFANTISKHCMKELVMVSAKNTNPEIEKLKKDLPLAVINIKIQEKNMFSRMPPDSEMADIGITIGCLKQLPESYGAIVSLFEDVEARRSDTTGTTSAVSSAPLPVKVEVPDTNAIYMRDGRKIENAIIVEIGLSEVKYKVGQRAVVYVIAKSDIATIFHEDGNKEVFGTVIKPQPQTSVKSPVKPQPEAACSPMSKPKLSIGAISGISRTCIEEFISLSQESGFTASNFFKELPVAVVKTKAQAKIPKTPFNNGPDPDNKVADIGITVGCLKEFPESASELTTAIKEVGLRLGFDAVMKEAVETEASDNIRFGIRLGYNEIDSYTKKGVHNWYAGLVVIIPLKSTINFNTGLDFSHRFYYPGGEKNEFAITSSALIQFKPFWKFYLTAGAQLDLTLVTLDGTSEDIFNRNRWVYDESNRIWVTAQRRTIGSIGPTFACGFMATSFMFDFKYSMFPDAYVNSKGNMIDNALELYGFGITYLF